MFYQTYTARKPLSACTAVTLSPRPRLRRNGVVCCCLQRTAHALLCIVNGDDSAVFFCFFCPWWPWPSTFDRDIQTLPSEGGDQTRFPCKLGANPFNRSRDISYTNKKMKNVTDSVKNSTLLECGNYADLILWIILDNIATYITDAYLKYG